MAVLLGKQPKRKSRSLIMLMDMRHAVPGLRRQGYEIACFGNASHYRQDGSCLHVDEIVANLQSDWHRARTWYLPFGDREQPPERARRVRMA